MGGENELNRRDMYHGSNGRRRHYAKARSEAREPDPVVTVDDKMVQAPLPHLTCAEWWIWFDFNESQVVVRKTVGICKPLRCGHFR